MQDLVTIITYGGPIMVLAEGEIAPDGPVNYSEQFEKDDELETSVLVYKDGEFVIKQPFGPASNEPVSLHTTNGDVQVLRGYDHNGQNAFFVLNEGDEIPAGEVRYDWTCSSGHSHWTAGTVGEVNETERPHWTFKKGPSNDKPNITAMVF